MGWRGVRFKVASPNGYEVIENSRLDNIWMRYYADRFETDNVGLREGFSLVERIIGPVEIGADSTGSATWEMDVIFYDTTEYPVPEGTPILLEQNTKVVINASIIGGHPVAEPVATVTTRIIDRKSISPEDITFYMMPPRNLEITNLTDAMSLAGPSVVGGKTYISFSTFAQYAYFVIPVYGPGMVGKTSYKLPEGFSPRYGGEGGQLLGVAVEWAYLQQRAGQCDSIYGMPLQYAEVTPDSISISGAPEPLVVGYPALSRVIQMPSGETQVFWLNGFEGGVRGKRSYNLRDWEDSGMIWQSSNYRYYDADLCFDGVLAAVGIFVSASKREVHFKRLKEDGTWQADSEAVFVGTIPNRIYIPSIKDVHGVLFIDHGILYKSTDGGQNWTANASYTT